jgi:hypothetical protein
MNKLLFLVSILAALVLLCVENLVGIHWDFHPDAVTYTSTSFEMVDNLIDAGLIASFNNFYYFFAALLQQNAILLIALNVIVYAFTNLAMYNYVKRVARKYNIAFDIKLILFLSCLLFMPYRLHLAVHVLKDTLIIFFLINLLSTNKVNLFISVFFLAGLRLFSFAYMSIFIKRKYFYIGAFFACLAAIYSSQEILNLIESTNDVDMNFREFDLVPNFTVYGIFGTLLRAIVWPIFAFTGAYLFISPSIAFAPLAIGSMAICIITWRAYKKPAINLQALIVFGLVAVLTTGFTTYIRYCFPLLVLVPLLQFKTFAKEESLRCKLNLKQNNF